MYKRQVYESKNYKVKVKDLDIDTVGKQTVSIEGKNKNTNEKHSAEAVSYTHLDVYKRQYQDRHQRLMQTQQDLNNRRNIVNDLKTKISKAVSYTHL